MINIPAIKLFNGVEMPTEGFGVFQISETECKNIVLDAIHIGYRLIDTASSYKNEQAVGDAVKQAIDECIVSRDELFITTKAYIQEMGYDNLKWAFERSLKNLGLEYLDLYLIHMPLGDYYGAWRAMEELYEQGRIRSIGVCNFDSARLMDLCYNATIKPMVNQILLHISNTPIELVEYCQKNNIAVEAYSPIAHGEILNQLEITTIAKKYGVTVPQLCIRYTLQLGAISLPKTGNPEHMKSNAQLDFQISAEDMELLKNFKKIKSYGDSGNFPVYGGKM